MRSFIAFLTCLFIIFNASCTKEAIIHPETQIEQSISNRSATTEIQVIVVSTNQTDGALNIEFSGASSGTIPAENQNLVFDTSEGTVSLALSVINSEFVEGNLSIDFDAEGIDLEGLDIQSVQSIIIDDNMVE